MRTPLLLLIAASLLSPSFANAQAALPAVQPAVPPTVPPAVQQPVNLGDRIPFDAAVRTGTLPNGVTFFVRKNERPTHRITLRLAVKAGSLFEADDQQGLAHLIEHMAFNGSEHFKPGELVSYFESVGARLGPHVNAYTSFDETVYMLDLPTDSPEVVAKGITALADFGGGLTLDPEQIDKERGVVVEEWRGRLGASTRIQQQQLPVIYYGSRYADRLPIGKPEVLRSAPAARLRAFYDTWYRPERLAVIAVGDIDPAALEATIRATFGALRDRAPAASAPDGTVPLHREALVKVISDPETTQTSVQLLRKRQREGTELVGDYRRSLVEALFEHMLNERFGDIAHRPDAPFLGAGVSDSTVSPTVATFSLSARVQEGRLTQGLSALEIEARRVTEHGFTASELDRAKLWLGAMYEQAHNERDKSESARYAQEYLGYFLEKEPSPGIDYEYSLIQRVVPGITLADIASIARSRLGGEGQVVIAITPQKAGVVVPAEAELTAALANAGKVAVTPWADTATATKLMETLPSAGAVESRRELTDIGVTVVRFANGVEAWLKPTDFKNDQVLFTMYAPGGASTAGPAGYLQARFATEYVELSGAGGFKAQDLEKMLTGRRASASAFASMSTHGISGSAAPADLETALQLLHLSFTAPGDDPQAFALMKQQLEIAAANRGRSPNQVFNEKITQVTTSNHYTSRPLTAEDVASLDRGKMLDTYRGWFKNAADFTVFMVGAFDTDTAVPLLARYVGSLPSTGAASSAYKDAGVRFPTGIERAKVEKGREPRSQTMIGFFADPPFDPQEQERVIAATSVLETVLRDSLREDLGQTYTVSVDLSQSPPERGDGYISIRFGAAPENIEAMTARVLDVVKRLQAEGPSPELVANARQGAKRDYETALRQNGYWMRRLQTIHLLKGRPSDILTRNNRIDAVTPAAVQEVLKKYLPLDRYAVITLVPESLSQ
jgi:zinc protease